MSHPSVSTVGSVRLRNRWVSRGMINSKRREDPSVEPSTTVQYGIIVLRPQVPCLTPVSSSVVLETDPDGRRLRDSLHV